MGFDVTADAYDRFMGAWSRLLSPGMISFAGVETGHRALDVGCGPGILTAALVERLDADSVAAVDPSASFVGAVRSRLPGVNVRQGSAEQLPFRDNRFDVVLAQLVVHFMADPIEGLKEMARVALPGGTVAVSVWDFGGGRGPLGPFWQAVAELDSDSAAESDLAGTGKGQLAALLSAADLSDISETELTIRRSFASFEEWWQPFTAGVGPAGGYVVRLEPEDRTRLLQRCRDLLPEGAFDLVAVAWAAKGTP